MKLTVLCACLFFAVLALGAQTPGSPPDGFLFRFDVVGSSGQTANIGSNDFPTFLEDLINGTSVFSTFQSDESFTADITFMGVPDALVLDASDFGRTAVLRSPLTGLTENFSGATRFDVEDQIDAYIESEGADEWARILAEIAKRSAASITDGSPNAATASIADQAFTAYGLGASTESEAFAATSADADEDAVASDEGSSRPSGFGFGVTIDSGRFDIDLPDGSSIEGSRTQVEIPISYTFNERVAIRVGIPFEYTDMEEAKVFGGGINVGLPLTFHRITAANKEKNFAWKMTPSGGVLGKGSEDTASGALLAHLGLTNAFDWRPLPNVLVSFGNQFTIFESLDFDYDEFELKTEIDQLIMKNGVRAKWRFQPRWIATGYLIDTRFLEDSAVESYQTIGAGLTFRVGKRSHVGMHGKVDTGDSYSGWQVSLFSGWNF